MTAQAGADLALGFGSRADAKVLKIVIIATSVLQEKR
jgi:hypothetical protein